MIFHVSRREDNLLDISFYVDGKCSHVSCAVEEKDLDECVFSHAKGKMTQILIPYGDWLEQGKPEDQTREVTCH